MSSETGVATVEDETVGEILTEIIQFCRDESLHLATCLLVADDKEETVSALKNGSAKLQQR